MICDDVKRVAYFFLDGNLGENKQTRLQDPRQHLPRLRTARQHPSPPAHVHQPSASDAIARRNDLRQRLTRDASARCAASST